MKQIIIMVAMMLLGIAIYQLIAGEGNGSIMESVGDLWQQEIALRSSYP